LYRFVLTMTRIRDYRDPFTGVGVRLSEDSAAATDFLIHEAGCLRYRDWNHRGIVSPYWRLHHNFAPGNSVVCDGTVFPLRRDVAVLTPAGVRIDTCGPRVLLHTWIHFTPTRGYRLPQREPFSMRLTPPLRSLLREVAAAFRSRRDRSHASRLHHLGQALLHGVFAGLEPGMYRSVPPGLGTLLARMEENPAMDLTVLALARMAGKSRSRFAAWFKQAVDETPAHYVQKLRIRVAATRLGSGDESVEEIAAATGFANRHHFTRVFSAMTGIGPGAYRKRHKQA
jgi:AraC family transcriptional regulator, arabinose operon regulatory protein